MGLALQHYARLAADTYAEQRAAEIRRRAERRAGELLSKMPKAKPPSGKGQAKNDRRSSQATDGPPTLADLGISTHKPRSDNAWRRCRNLNLKPQRASLNPGQRDHGGMTVRLYKHEAVPNCGSFEVRFPDGKPSRYFYWDDAPGRRMRSELLTGEQALEQAKAFARNARDEDAG